MGEGGVNFRKINLYDFYLKGTVSVISSDLPFVACSIYIDTFKPLSDQGF